MRDKKSKIREKPEYRWRQRVMNQNSLARADQERS